ncbi:MAG: DUF4102 domain-containing protein [Methylocystaceae bacterium]|nr:DUF4102 domain-containing protein [Methylocystaceae bacterium]
MAEAFKLTQSFAKSVIPNGKRMEYRDTEVRGFGLLVQASGTKSYFLRINPWGFKTLGRVTEIPLDRARRTAADLKLRIKAGANPFSEIKENRAKELAKKAPKLTLNEAWESYERDILSAKSDSHRRNCSRSMRTHFLSEFGRRAPNEISRKEFFSFREKHERARPAEMRQMRAYVRHFYSWMSERADFHELVSDLPNFGKLQTQPNIRTRKLTSREDIQRLWYSFDVITPKAAALALKFLLLSNRRAIEVRRMKLDQIDLERGIWTVPAGKGKRGRQVLQPLTPLMMDIVKEAMGDRKSGFVFSSKDGDKMVEIGSKIVRAMVAAANIQHISLHDFRRTISTGMEELGVPYRVISLSAGHYDAGIEAHYQQAEKRPFDEMLFAYLKWEQYICEKGQ